MRNEHGEATRVRPTTTKVGAMQVVQDLVWPDSIVAATMTDGASDIEAFRERITDDAFTQPSFQTRHRYASYFIKWFLPSISLTDPVAIVWKAFHDKTSLEHVMRWQFVTSNPLVAGFVDGELAHVPPGDVVDGVAQMYLAQTIGAVNERTINRLKASLRKIGLLELHQRAHYRIIPDVSPRAVAVLLACLFAPEPQAVSMATLMDDPWWKRLGLIDGAAVRTKLQETADRGLITRVAKMDSLDQITTRYSLAQFTAGKLKSSR